MKSSILTPAKVLNTAFRKVRPNVSEFNRFKNNLIILLDKIKIVEQRPKDESEEHLKNDIRDFLRDTYYRDAYAINTKDKKDLVIHLSKDTNSPVGVLIEAKRPSNKSEMVSRDNLNKKALHELVLYYLRERVTHDNKQVRHLIITNINEWYIFKADQFEKLFFTKKFVAEFKDFEEKRLVGKDTSFFYTQIAKPYIDRLDTEIECTYFNFQDYDQLLRNENKEDDKKLITLFKLLSPEHILNLPFVNDSNSLNKEFYNELLHIMGLHEYKEGGKKLINRNPEGARHSGSILEDAILQLDSLDKISRIERPGRFGATKERRLFSVALELTITWINRILFLKLLEAQLKSYHKEDSSYSFLNLQRIKSYDDLNSLFFQVLARKHEDRNADVKKVFEKVPYLNSSLFEPSEIEHNTLLISNLRDNKLLQLYSKTVLKNGQGKRLSGTLPTLEYLFRFLDAYDFNVESDGDTKEDDKELISASVLGLIFEKINGYKDGSFFTPGFITMYMCREALRRATVQKFRNSDYFHDFNTDDFEGLVYYLSRKYSPADIREANNLVNNLKICDPAVGSGHFLVSALNEMLAIKSELGILCNRNGQPLRVRLEVANDELSVKWRQSDELYHYTPGVQESQEVQEALFHEKQLIIESCLFGVDINPNSVKICRLRLWIELLKNAYYKNARELETLPNIDINIKCGNSLVSRFALDADLKQALKKSQWTIDSYRLAVQTYRNAKSKEEKREMESLILKIKQGFSTEIRMNDPLKKRLDKLANELYHRFTGTFLFEPESPYGESEKSLDKRRKLEKQKLEKEIETLNAKIEEIKSNKVFEDAFEWRFEFPEVLNDEGDFVGFDVVLGNPPYIRQEEFSDIKSYLKQRYETFAGTADLLVYFIELGHRILAPNGQFSFIIANKFMRAGFGKALRTWLVQRRLLEIVDFGDLPVFEQATTYPCILSWQNAEPKQQFLAANVTELRTADFQEYLPTLRFSSLQSSLDPEGWTLADASIQQLLQKLKQTGVPLGEYVEGKIYYGIKTGFNEAFVIDAATKERLIAEDPRSAEVIKPFLAGRDVKRYQVPQAEKFLILFPKGWTIQNAGKLDEKVALAFLMKQLPAIATQLMPFADAARKRTDQGDYWWELRACDYYEEFENEKITWPETSLDNQVTVLPKGVYLNKTTFFIPLSDYFLLGLLNSNLVRFYLDQIVSKMRGGYFSLSKIYMETIPVAVNNSIPIADKAKAILQIHRSDPGADTTSLETEIDQLVYQLYELTEEEIGIVEGL